MKSFYEVINIDLAQEYTKARKLAKLDSMVIGDAQVEIAVKTAIEGMDIPEDDDRHHWINVIAHKAAADLLALGKVQPENMVEMAALSEEDFTQAVTVAVGKARALNDQTVAAEANLNTDTISETIT